MSETTISKRLSSKIPYDITVIGVVLLVYIVLIKLSKYKRVILFDERNYIGGRIYTHPMQYEVGAARFNNNHKLLLELIDEFGLTSIPISKEMDYIKCSKNRIKN